MTSLLEKNFWLKLEKASIDTASIINGKLYISLTPNNCVLEFRNTNQAKQCVEKMEIEIREHYIQIRFDIILNFGNYIVEDCENHHFCLLIKKNKLDFGAMIFKINQHTIMVKRFLWAVRLLKQIKYLFKN
jgi:hypothetical protein